MATVRVDLEVNTKGQQGITSTATAMDGLGAAAKRADQSLNSWTNTQQRAAQKMERLHEEALKMNLGFSSTDDKAKIFSDTLGKMSTTATQTAAALGLPIGQLGLLNSATEVAALGFGQLTKSAVGFNAASIIVVGAGAAIGGAMGTMILKINGAADAYQELAREALNYFGLLAKYNGPSGQGFEARMAADAEQAIQRRIATWKSMGKSLSEIEDLLANKQKTISEKAIEQIRKEDEARKKAAEEAKRAYKEQLDDIHTAFKMQDDARDKEYKNALDKWKEADAKQKAAKHFAAERDQDALEKELAAQQEAWKNLFDYLDDLARQEQQQFQKYWMDLATSFSGVAAAFASTGDLFVALGGKADSFFGKAIAGFARLADSLGNFAAAMASGNLFAQIGAGIGVLASLFGLGGDNGAAQREALRKQQEDDLKRMMDSARAQRAGGINALGSTGSAYFASHTILTAEDARREGALFAAAWGQMVKEKGIVAAAAAFKDAFEKIGKELAAAGLDKPEWFKAIEGLMTLGLDEKFVAIASAANDAALFLKALAESGVAGPEIIAAFEEEARRAFEEGRKRALELGQAPEQAVKAGFAAANPLLKELLNQSILNNQTLSKDIQDMIDQAGIVPDVEFQQLDELRHIRAAVEALAGIHPNTTTTDPSNPNAPGPPGKSGPGKGHGPKETSAGPTTLVVPVHIGGEKLDEIVINTVTWEVQRRGPLLSYIKQNTTGKP